MDLTTPVIFGNFPEIAGPIFPNEAAIPFGISAKSFTSLPSGPELTELLTFPNILVRLGDKSSNGSSMASLMLWNTFAPDCILVPRLLIPPGIFWNLAVTPPLTSPNPPRTSENVPALLPINENAGTAPIRTADILPRFASCPVSILPSLSVMFSTASAKPFAAGTESPILSAIAPTTSSPFFPNLGTISPRFLRIFWVAVPIVSTSSWLVITPPWKFSHAALAELTDPSMVFPASSADVPVIPRFCWITWIAWIIWSNVTLSRSLIFSLRIPESLINRIISDWVPP